MQVFIPTYRRSARQHTFKAMPTEWQDKTTFVCDEYDAKYLADYHPGVPCWIVPDGITIAKKRAFIIEKATSEKIVMFDDDLRFSVRIDANSTKLRQATRVDVGKYLVELDEMLDTYAHAGWSARQGNNRLPGGWRGPGRMCYVLGYRPEILRKHCELGRIETREDMDYTLQLLRAGFDNRISGDIAADQHTGFAAAGGCSNERTMERSNADAFKLAELHPGLVRTAEKQYSASVPRIEVVCSWKKALLSADTEQTAEGWDNDTDEVVA